MHFERSFCIPACIARSDRRTVLYDVLGIALNPVSSPNSCRAVTCESPLEPLKLVGALSKRGGVSLCTYRRGRNRSGEKESVEDSVGQIGRCESALGVLNDYST